jgi:hypothetical protein
MKKLHHKLPPWRKLEKAIRAAVEDHAEKLVTDWAMEEKRAFIERIKKQKFASFKKKPLSPKYLARKIAKGADRRTMIATGHYIRSIKLFRTRSGKRLLLRIGFPPNAKAHDLDGKRTTTPLAITIRANELGSAARNIPPRPHWRPFRLEMKARAKKLRIQIKKAVVKTVREELEKLP